MLNHRQAHLLSMSDQLVKNEYLLLSTTPDFSRELVRIAPKGATTTICLDTAIACKQVLRTNYQSLYGPQVARRTYYLDTR